MKMSKLGLKKKMQTGKVMEDKLGTQIVEKKGVTGTIADDTETGLQMSLILQGAIANAQKHNIKLEPGQQNMGGGDCSYLSVIYNINDRRCFHNKLPMSPEYYRRVWNIDLMNKILDGKIPWNPGYTKQEIRDGFKEISEAGVYERSYFGDMMLAGIACGVRKRILIFNTHKRTIHDPISVVDPRDYSGDLDSEIPVVVAYNMVHFESLHPVDEKDIQETVKLASSYSSGSYKKDYGFTGQNMHHLTSDSDVNPTKIGSIQESETDQIRSPPRKKQKKGVKAKVIDATKKDEKNQDETEDFIFENIRFKENEKGKITCGVCEVECIRLIVHMNDNKYCTEYFSDMAKFKIEYSKYRDRTRRRGKNEIRGNGEKNSSQETCGKRKQNCEPLINKKKVCKESGDDVPKVYQNNDGNQRKDVCFKFGGVDFKEIENEKIRCGICQAECGRLIVHMNKSTDCAKHFSMSDFKVEYSKYRHRKRVKKMKLS